jgi:hypothetical protein
MTTHALPSRTTCDQNHGLIDTVQDADSILVYHGSELYTDRQSSVCHQHVVHGESRCHQWLRIYDISASELLGQFVHFYMRIFVNRPLI